MSQFLSGLSNKIHFGVDLKLVVLYRFKRNGPLRFYEVNSSATQENSRWLNFVRSWRKDKKKSEENFRRRYQR